MTTPAAPYASITFAQAKTELLTNRLNSTGADFWTTAEAGIYLTEALQLWNCLTQTYVQDFTASYMPNDFQWQGLANQGNSFVGHNASSPRSQTLNSSYVYTLIQYHFLEPPTGLTWTGTPQFSAADLSQSFQRRRDEILQAVASNVGPFSSTFGLPVGSNRVYLPDVIGQSILDIRRMRFLPANNFTVTPAIDYGSPSTLYREDGLAIEYFDSNFTTGTPSPPFAYDLIAGPPLALSFDVPGNVPNTLDILAMLSGGPVPPGTSVPLLIPNDWNWVLKFGIMADLLRKEAESTDLERAAYCERRFQEGIQLMQEMPWLLQGRINNIPVDTPDVAEADTFSYEWESDYSAQPMIVRGGIDLFAWAPPLAGQGYGDGGYGDGGYGGDPGPVAITLSLVANMPVPVADGDFLQVSRDVFDAILDYAEHIAQFKHGGFEFAQSMNLYKNFVATAVATNSRLRESGIFATTLRPPESKQDANDPRFATQGTT